MRWARRGRGGRGVARWALVAAGLAPAACELTDETLTSIDDVVVVEALVLVVPGSDLSPNFARVMLHRTLGEDGTSRSVPGAEVMMRSGSEGIPLGFVPAGPADCATILPESGGGSCYLADDFEEPIRPGDLVELVIELPDGGRLESATRVPGAFDLTSVASDQLCRLSPRENLELVWRRSEGAWAYLVETAIFGLPEALEPVGIEVEDDPLILTGVAISENDTTLAYPAQMGLFDRTELDRDLALVLQEGLPEGTGASITVAAVDRNYVNWARGGNFNPSGPVRVPSVVGDGTGFFGSGVLRSFTVAAAEPEPGGPPPCGA